MKKVLVSGFMAKNFGDDLFFKILFDRYKTDNVIWYLDTGYSSYSDIFKEYKNVNILNSFFHKVLRKLKLQHLFFSKLDAAVFIGGSIFMEHDTWEEKFNYKEDINKLVNNIYFLGCNFGPFNSKKYMQKHSALFSKSTDICFRDSYSYDLFAHLSNVRLEKDIIFGLNTENSCQKQDNTIGISVIDLLEKKELKDYKEDYIEKIVEIIECAIHEKQKVTLFSFCEQQGDLKTCQIIAEIIKGSINVDLEIVNYNGDIEEFLNRFSEMKNIIGTRFHACVLSQVFNQGLYPIIYSQKTSNMLKDIDLYDIHTEIANIKKLDAQSVLIDIKTNKVKNRELIRGSEQHFKKLDEYIVDKIT